VLTNLFRTEGANSVQPKAEDYPILFSETNVEAGKLTSNRTTVPTMTKGERRADERTISTSGTLLKIKEERSATEETFVAIPEKS